MMKIRFLQINSFYKKKNILNLIYTLKYMKFINYRRSEKNEFLSSINDGSLKR